MGRVALEGAILDPIPAEVLAAAVGRTKALLLMMADWNVLPPEAAM